MGAGQYIGGSARTACRRPHRSDTDQGATFIELLVAIVLLGSAVIAILASLQATTVASTVDANHARAFTWLQSASDEVFEAPRIPCAEYDGSGNPASKSNYDDRRGSAADPPSGVEATATVWAMYKDAITKAPKPEGWATATIVITDISFLGKPNPDDTFFEWDAAYCFEGVQPDANGDGNDEDYRVTPLLSQKISIEVTSPDGDVVKTIETVKSDR